MKNFILILFFLFVSISFGQIKEDNRIHFDVDQLATYKGGYPMFSKYISDNINCKVKINRKEKNEIQLRFVIEKNGEILIAEVLSTKPFKCKDEIIAALKQNKNWNPALKDNLPVRSIVQMDVNLEK